MNQTGATIERTGTNQTEDQKIRSVKAKLGTGESHGGGEGKWGTQKSRPKNAKRGVMRCGKYGIKNKNTLEQERKGKVQGWRVQTDRQEICGSGRESKNLDNKLFNDHNGGLVEKKLTALKPYLAGGWNMRGLEIGAKLGR